MIAKAKVLIVSYDCDHMEVDTNCKKKVSYERRQDRMAGMTRMRRNEVRRSSLNWMPSIIPISNCIFSLVFIKIYCDCCTSKYFNVDQNVPFLPPIISYSPFWCVHLLKASKRCGGGHMRVRHEVMRDVIRRNLMLDELLALRNISHIDSLCFYTIVSVRIVENGHLFLSDMTSFSHLQTKF